MIDVDDASQLSVSTALRDLADRVDEAGADETVVCVIGSGTTAKIYALSGDLPTILANTATLLEGVVAGLPAANSKRQH
jgi:hypothetical protein